MHLREYQSKIIEDVRGALKTSKKILIQLATGGGKTAIAAFMAKGIKERGKNLWFIAHRDFLLEQTSKTFMDAGLNHSFIAAGRVSQPDEQIQICSIQTLVKRINSWSPPDFIIWDEAHHCMASNYKKIAAWAQDATHIGLSATPVRLDGKGLGDLFDDMVTGQTPAWLIDNGYLSQYKAYAPSKPNLEKIHTVAGDYNREELGFVMDQGQIIGDMVRHWKQYAEGLLTVFFAVNIKHSKNIAASFNAAGIPALHLDASTTSQERAEACRKLAMREIMVIVNSDLFGEGFDVASQAGMDVSIECVGLARPTQSLGLHLQQIGRALRPSKGKTHAVILDFAGNLIKHGLPDEEREWSLDAKKRVKKSSSESVTPVKNCKACLGIYSRAKSSCPYCGAVEVIETRSIKEIEGELKAVDKYNLLLQRKEVGKSRTRAELEALAIKRGYKRGWVYNIMKARGIR